MRAQRTDKLVVLSVPSSMPARDDITFPYRVDSHGRTASAGYDDHVRQMIEQLLFTSPGERVMLPDFGCGLLDLVFEPNSPELASTLQLSVQAALQRWLGDVITVQRLDIVSQDGQLSVHLSYVVLPTGSQQTDVFVRGGTP